MKSRDYLYVFMKLIFFVEDLFVKTVLELQGKSRLLKEKGKEIMDKFEQAKPYALIAEIYKN